MPYKVLGRWIWLSDIACYIMGASLLLGFLTALWVNYTLGLTSVVGFGIAYLVVLNHLEPIDTLAHRFAPGFLERWNLPGVALMIMLWLVWAWFSLPVAVICALMMVLALIVDEAGTTSPSGLGKVLKRYIGFVDEFTPESQDRYDRDHHYGKYNTEDWP